jgi:hypothetical protein
VKGERTGNRFKIFNPDITVTSSLLDLGDDSLEMVFDRGEGMLDVMLANLILLHEVVDGLLDSDDDKRERERESQTETDRRDGGRDRLSESSLSIIGRAGLEIFAVRGLKIEALQDIKIAERLEGDDVVIVG